MLIGKRGALDHVGVTDDYPINNARRKCGGQSAAEVLVFRLFKTSSLSPLLLLVHYFPGGAGGGFKKKNMLTFQWLTCHLTGVVRLIRKFTKTARAGVHSSRPPLLPMFITHEDGEAVMSISSAPVFQIKTTEC